MFLSRQWGDSSESNFQTSGNVFFFPRQEVCQLFQNPLKSSFGKAGTNTTKLHIVAVVMKDTGY